MQAGLDAETPAQRSSVGTVLSGLVPGRAVTPAMLARAVAGVLELYDDIVGA